MQYVKLVNRTGRKLKGTWDGKIYEIAPNGAYQFPLAVAQAIKRQNPIMGSEDPYNMTMDYLVGIEEEGDPIDALTDEQAFAKAVEKWDRTKLIGALPSEVVAGKAGLYAHEKHSPVDSGNGAVSGGFVTP